MSKQQPKTKVTPQLRGALLRSACMLATEDELRFVPQELRTAYECALSAAAADTEQLHSSIQTITNIAPDNPYTCARAAFFYAAIGSDIQGNAFTQKMVQNARRCQVNMQILGLALQAPIGHGQ